MGTYSYLRKGDTKNRRDIEDRIADKYLANRNLSTRQLRWRSRKDNEYMSLRDVETIINGINRKEKKQYKDEQKRQTKNIRSGIARTVDDIKEYLVFGKAYIVRDSPGELFSVDYTTRSSNRAINKFNDTLAQWRIFSQNAYYRSGSIKMLGITKKGYTTILAHEFVA